MIQGFECPFLCFSRFRCITDVVMALGSHYGFRDPYGISLEAPCKIHCETDVAVTHGCSLTAPDGIVVVSHEIDRFSHIERIECLVYRTAFKVMTYRYRDAGSL